MHEQMQRLYRAAEELKNLSGQSEVAHFLNQSPQTLNNWESRGMSKRGLLLSHQKIGCSVVWLETGVGPMADDEKIPALAIKAAGGRKVWVIGNGQGGFPDRIWGDGDYPVGASDEYAEVVSDDSRAFVVRVWGESMVPRYMPGEYALVEPGTAPEIEDDVLVRLKSGETMIKRLLSRRAGIRLGSYGTAEVLTYAPEEITWIYYVSHPIPARKIKHWVEVPEYTGEERRQEVMSHEPERRSGYVLPKPKSEMEHVYGRNLAPGERATPPAQKRRKVQ
jgi:phage repressor protein C with HTH and peptisase S24 domain